MKQNRRIKTILNFLLFSILSCIALTSCEKENEINLSGTDYLIFGHYYGECTGESCVEIFRLENDKLLEDTKDNYPSSAGFYQGNYIKLPDAKYDLVKGLPNFFPNDLLNEDARVIGEPDAGDWGGLYVEYNYNGRRQFWLIDKMKSNLPDYLQEFVDKANETIVLINE